MPRKKTISPEAMEILAQVICADFQWTVYGNELRPIAELIVAGYMESADESAIASVRVTTAGVRAALAAGNVEQHGTRFKLVGIEPRRVAAPRTTAPTPLRLVEPKAPDPFAEGMTAAMDGQFATCPYAEGSQEAQDWAAGYGAGGQAKKYVS